MTDPTYETFLQGKATRAEPVGFEAGPLHPALFPFQEAMVRRALRLGRAAFWADCGLGKTLMQLVWARSVVEHTKGNVLVLAPLAVAVQTVREGERFGIVARYARSQEEVQPGVTVTNYDRLERFSAASFAGVVLDESSILKSFMGKTKRQLVEAFAATRFRLACTATPAPNDVMELGNHAAFLGVMESSEMLMRWFINDAAQTGVYRLKGHAEADFWRWIATWAMSVATPSDLLDPDGKPYSDEGYVLPGLSIVEHVVKGPPGQPGGGELFDLTKVNATTLHRQLKKSLSARAARAVEIVRTEPGEPWVIWVNTNEEADALNARLPEALEVRGSDSAEQKDWRLNSFSMGATRLLVTKASLAGYGLNWQHCARHVFMSISYSFEDFYQALRRSFRFGQSREVQAHIIMSGAEAGVRAVVAGKQEAHKRQQERMVSAMREVHLEDERERLAASVGSGSLRVQRGQGYELHLGDAVEVSRGLRANSMHLSVFSPPFSSLYTYSPSLRDMGNCANDAEFFQHFSFLIPELLRITVPGRLCVVHSKDLPRYESSSGSSGLKDFPGELTRAFEGAVGADGSRWVYHSRCTIWKSPVTEMRRTNTRRLLYKTLRTDASHTGFGTPDYLTIYRKWTPGQKEAEVPILHTKENFPLEQWQEWASPVWMTVDQTDVLNVQQARSSQDEKHICPLQLDVIERSIILWSNPGERVFSPFAGIGSEGYIALKKGRVFTGVELKPQYFEVARRNLDGSTAQLDLFNKPSFQSAASLEDAHRNLDAPEAV